MRTGEAAKESHGHSEAFSFQHARLERPSFRRREYLEQQLEAQLNDCFVEAYDSKQNNRLRGLFEHCELAKMAQVVLDDQDSSVRYLPARGGIWLHDVNQGNPLHNGTVSYSNSPEAWYTFNFTGTGFGIWGSQKQDRGKFLVQIDGVFAGSGDAFEAGIDTDSEAKSLFAIEDLLAAQHSIEVYNFRGSDIRIPGGGQAFIALDFLQVNTAAATTTLGYAGTGYPSQTTSTGSGLHLSDSDKGDSQIGAGVIAGAVVGSIAALSVLAALLFFLCRRRRAQRWNQSTARPQISNEEEEDYNFPRPAPFDVNHYVQSRSSLQPPDTPDVRQSFLHSRHSTGVDSYSDGPLSASDRPTSSYMPSNADTPEEDGCGGRPPPSYENASTIVESSQSSSAPTQMRQVPVPKGHI